MMEFLDRLDLSTLHATLCLIGILFSIWCHQLWGREFFGTEHSPKVRVMQRTAFILLSLSLCWSLSYAHVRNWQPWPSYVVTLIAVDLYLFSILYAAGTKRRLMG